MPTGKPADGSSNQGNRSGRGSLGRRVERALSAENDRNRPGRRAAIEQRGRQAQDRARRS